MRGGAKGKRRAGSGRLLAFCGVVRGRNGGCYHHPHFPIYNPFPSPIFPLAPPPLPGRAAPAAACRWASAAGAARPTAPPPRRRTGGSGRPRPPRAAARTPARAASAGRAGRAGWWHAGWSPDPPTCATCSPGAAAIGPTPPPLAPAPAYLQQMVAVAAARAHGARVEQVLPRGQLPHHAPQRPHVSRRVVPGLQDDLHPARACMCVCVCACICARTGGGGRRRLPAAPVRSAAAPTHPPLPAPLARGTAGSGCQTQTCCRASRRCQSRPAAGRRPAGAPPAPPGPPDGGRNSEGRRAG